MSDPLVALAHRDLPTQTTFFVSEFDVSRGLASAGRAGSAPAEDLRPGVRVIDTSAARKVYPGRWGLSPRLWRDGLNIALRPEGVTLGWPRPVWQVGEVEGLRWAIVEGKQGWLLADAYTLLGPVARSESLGVDGKAVGEIHDTISTLTPDRVHAFGWRGYAVFDDPALDRRSDPLRSALSIAGPYGTLERDFEKRAQEVDPDAGGEVWLHGEYPIYRLTDELWLGAMAAAKLAAKTQLLTERMTPGQVELRMRPWRVLIGDLAADRLPEMTDPRLSVPPSADLIRTLVPWQERGPAGRVWSWVTFPYRHPIWTALLILLVIGLLAVRLLILLVIELFVPLVIGLLVLLVIGLLWRHARR